MKLLRYGPRGQEKPGLLDAEGRIRDLSGVVADITPDQLWGEGLAALKAVDPATYQAAGDLATDPPGRLADLLAARDGVPGALADPALLTRLDVKVGDRITIAGHDVVIRGTIVSEPDHT